MRLCNQVDIVVGNHIRESNDYSMVSSCSLSNESLNQYLVMGHHKDLDGIELIEVKFFSWLSHETKALQVYLHGPKTPKTG